MPQGGIIASRALHKLSTDSQYFGKLPPGEEEIIRSIRQQYNAKVNPSGALAAYDLGLTDKLPDTIVYETDKRIRRLLSRHPKAQLSKAIALWPRWFQEQIRPLIQVTDKPYITGLSALNVPYQGKQADWHQMVCSIAIGFKSPVEITRAPQTLVRMSCLIAAGF